MYCIGLEVVYRVEIGNGKGWAHLPPGCSMWGSTVHYNYNLAATRSCTTTGGVKYCICVRIVGDNDHELTYKPIDDASERYCDMCCEILGKDNDFCYVCFPCEWSICTACLDRRFSFLHLWRITNTHPLPLYLLPMVDLNSKVEPNVHCTTISHFHRPIKRCFCSC